MNSTSFNNLPEVICRLNSASLREAIDVHSLRSFLAFLAALDDPHNPHNPAYKAIFKNKDRFPNIKHQWRAISDLTPRWDGEGEPTFRCIYSESEAQHLAPTAPNLWENCGSPDALGLKAVGTTVFVCPPFFSFPDAYPVGSPEQCPDVVNNEFVRSPSRPGFLADKSKVITRTMLLYYGCKVNSTYHFTSVVEQENEILRRNNEATYNECTSNLFFQNCGSNHEFHSALSSLRRNHLMMQQWCGMNAEISLMWTSHRGPTLQLSTQAWLETSPAPVTAPATIPQTPR